MNAFSNSPGTDAGVLAWWSGRRHAWARAAVLSLAKLVNGEWRALPVGPENAVSVQGADAVTLDATIPTGQTKAAQPVDLGVRRAVALRSPIGIGPTAVSFDVGTDPAALLPLQFGGALYTVTVGGGAWTPLDPLLFAGFRCVRPVLSVAPAANRVFGVLAQ